MPKKAGKISVRKATILGKKIEEQKKQRKKEIEANRAKGEIKKTSLYKGLDY